MILLFAAPRHPPYDTRYTDSVYTFLASRAEVSLQTTHSRARCAPVKSTVSNKSFVIAFLWRFAAANYVFLPQSTKLQAKTQRDFQSSYYSVRLSSVHRASASAVARQRIDSALHTNTWFYTLRINSCRYIFTIDKDISSGAEHPKSSC